MRSWGLRHRAYRTTRRGVGRPSGAVRALGLALRGEARHDSRPNRVHLRCGLIVHLRLLSTPPCGDAVTFGYGVPDHPDEDLHLADSMRSQAHPLVASPPGHRAGVRATRAPPTVSPTGSPENSSGSRRTSPPYPQGGWHGTGAFSGPAAVSRRSMLSTPGRGWSAPPGRSALARRQTVSPTGSPSPGAPGAGA